MLKQVLVLKLFSVPEKTPGIQGTTALSEFQTFYQLECLSVAGLEGVQPWQNPEQTIHNSRPVLKRLVLAYGVRDGPVYYS